MTRFFFIFLLVVTSNSFAQDKERVIFTKGNEWFTEDVTILNKKRRNLLLVSQATLFTGSLLALDRLWYDDYSRSSFHFINDNQEWLQMDKAGHLTTSYYSGLLGIKAYKWTGMKRNNAIWHGGLTGTYFLAIIEFLDGKSEDWGASFGDLAANLSGSMLAIGQALFWDEQRIQLKYSYSPSLWAAENSNQLGENNIERLLKDYNGQTYWLSMNMKSLLNIQYNTFPAWLNISFGYSGDKMIYPYQEKQDVTHTLQRERQYFFSFDVDLNKIKTSNKKINNLLSIFGFLKFPAPAIELREGSFYFHPMYY